MNKCRTFRDSLELILKGAPQPKRLVPLAWDEHLLSCEDCRELLRGEQALEMLLASLPKPKLPAELVARILKRLQHERLQLATDIEVTGQKALDDLLEYAPEPVAPINLASKVLAGLAHERRLEEDRVDSALDELLDRVPEPVPPSDLVSGILEVVRTDRSPSRLHLLQSARLWIPLAAAVLLAGLWIQSSWDTLKVGPVENHPLDAEPVAVAELNDEMVAAFDVLENWEYLNGEDLDLLLASIDELDELLIETSEWDLEVDPFDETEQTSGG